MYVPNRETFVSPPCITAAAPVFVAYESTAWWPRPAPGAAATTKCSQRRLHTDIFGCVSMAQKAKALSSGVFDIDEALLREAVIYLPISVKPRKNNRRVP